MSDLKDRFLQLKYGELTDCCSALTIEYSESDIPPINKSEVLRYSGVPVSAQDESLDSLFDEVCKMAHDTFSYKVAYAVRYLYFDNEKPKLIFEHQSKAIAENLCGCFGIVYFAATVGSKIDSLIRRYEKIAPTKSLLLQGLGAERVEALCDMFNDKITEVACECGFDTARRFSPGYADLPLEGQKEILPFLNATKFLGITLNDSLLMNPSKSVTALVGIKK